MEGFILLTCQNYLKQSIEPMQSLIKTAMTFKNKDFIYLSEKESERAQAGGAAGRGRSRLPSEQGVQGRTQFQDLGIVAEFFSPLVPVVLGHAALKNGEVDQTEWWAAKQGLLSITKVIVQSSRGGRGPERVVTGVSKSRGF